MVEQAPGAVVVALTPSARSFPCLGPSPGGETLDASNNVPPYSAGTFHVGRYSKVYLSDGTSATVIVNGATPHPADLPAKLVGRTENLDGPPVAASSHAGICCRHGIFTPVAVIRMGKVFPSMIYRRLA